MSQQLHHPPLPRYQRPSEFSTTTDRTLRRSVRSRYGDSAQCCKAPNVLPRWVTRAPPAAAQPSPLLTGHWEKDDLGQGTAMQPCLARARNARNMAALVRAIRHYGGTLAARRAWTAFMLILRSTWPGASCELVLDSVPRGAPRSPRHSLVCRLGCSRLHAARHLLASDAPHCVR